MSAAKNLDGSSGRVTTSDVLKAMLTENTGTHFLDSGGANGRAWQRNQGRDFDKEPSGILSVRIWKPAEHKADWDVTLSTYHFLNERVRFLPDWQARFDAYVESHDYERRSTPWLALMEGFFDDLKERGHEVTGPSGGDERFTVNTYNHPSFLSQVLQYVAAAVDDVPLYLLQIHGGADVRGGYTAPKFFGEGGHSELALLGDYQCVVACDKCEANWCNDGHSFGYDGGSGDPLNEYPVVTAGVLFNGKKVRGPAEGRVFLYADKSVSCPKCAKGKLHAYSC